jgi:FkbM family methyltransferase
MSRIERPLSKWQKIGIGLTRISQVARAAKTFKNWLEMTRIYAGAAMPNDFLVKGRSGFSLPLQFPSDVQTTWVVFCSGEYYLPEGCRTVLDLGANIGAFTLRAAYCGRAQQIYSLEPVAATFAALEENIRANGVPNATLVRKGIGRATERRTIYLGTASPHSSIIFRGMREDESGQTEQVEIITLSDLFNELSIDEVDMAKMDCEGGEVEAILAASDATLRRIKHISMEYHFPANISNETELFGRLKRAGFRCRSKSRAGRLAQFERI